ncbi:hypothetical protein [Mycolicibacterium llatzerense]|uniref:hypothetical protein n=1 Tax=Mycolicibacterium llatzerense TaxID=280871 RepID=UPI0008DCE16B|nr:hypothetical protein [Mycolicibacterium llatzerense]
MGSGDPIKVNPAALVAAGGTVSAATTKAATPPANLPVHGAVGSPADGAWSGIVTGMYAQSAAMGAELAPKAPMVQTAAQQAAASLTAEDAKNAGDISKLDPDVAASAARGSAPGGVPGGGLPGGLPGGMPGGMPGGLPGGMPGGGMPGMPSAPGGGTPGASDQPNAIRQAGFKNSTGWDWEHDDVHMPAYPTGGAEAGPSAHSKAPVKQAMEMAPVNPVSYTEGAGGEPRTVSTAWHGSAPTTASYGAGTSPVEEPVPVVGAGPGPNAPTERAPVNWTPQPWKPPR